MPGRTRSVGSENVDLNPPQKAKQTEEVDVQGLRYGWEGIAKTNQNNQNASGAALTCFDMILSLGTQASDLSDFHVRNDVDNASHLNSRPDRPVCLPRSVTGYQIAFQRMAMRGNAWQCVVDELAMEC
jgi:hypothetical protein